MARNSIWQTASRQSTHELSGVKWAESFNCYTATIAGWLKLSFSYQAVKAERGYYSIIVGGATLKAHGTDPLDSSQIAVEAARRLLAKASEELKDKN